MRKTLETIALLAALVVAVACASFAQDVSGLTGVVTDNSGAAIAGVTVKLTNPLTGFTGETTTNDAGQYSFAKVPTGVGYKITFSKENFATLDVTDVSLSVGTTVTHNAKMQVGAVSTTVEVTAAGAATINTTDASVGSVLTPQQIVTLPTLLRNSPAAMLSYAPGAIGNTGGGTNRDGTVTGARTDQSNITVDGIDANDIATGQFGVNVGNAPIDSVQEFQTVTAIPGASDGTSGAAQIKIVTKSGTNSFHGSLYEFNRNTVTAANDWFNDRAGIPVPALNRNQFGGAIGGPVKKDKLFFFFNYEGRRDASQTTEIRTVPLNSLRNGQFGYINDTAGCTSASRQNTTPNCISFLTAAQVAQLDPKSAGYDTTLMTFINTRYPMANDLTLGDGINTGGFRFNAAVPLSDNTYVARVDYNFTPNQKIFGRFNIVRSAQTDDVNTDAIHFPGDPPTGLIQQQDTAWAVGHSWTINPTMINQLTVGVSKSILNFPAVFFPNFPNEFTLGGGLTNPFPNDNGQFRTIPLYTFRDDFTLTHGNHTIQFGGEFRPAHVMSTLINDTTGIDIGLGGGLSALNASVRPNGANVAGVPGILNSNTAISNYDSMFATVLGRFADVNNTFNYTAAGVPLPAGTGSTRDFHYNNSFFYGSDTWRVTNSLTLTYGLSWSYYGVPYEVNGQQSVPSLGLNDIFNNRVANAANGTPADPNITYTLGGRANSSRGYYQPDLANFAPHLGIAYSPSVTNGLFGRLLGDRKTVFRLGGSENFDRSATTLTFIDDQASYLFNSFPITQFGTSNVTTSLQNDPRFTSFTVLPATNTPPKFMVPVTPNVDPTTGIPFGTATNQNNYAVDPNYKTPREYVFGAGIQRELPGRFLIEADYVGRLGRSLFAEGDASQALNFIDPGSKQGMFNAFTLLQKQLNSGVAPSAVMAQPWIENQVAAAIGGTCASVLGSSCTSFLASNFTGTIERGSMVTLLRNLNIDGLINPNVGINGQFFQNAYVTNLGASSYNGLVLSIKRRVAHDLTLDFNYAYSHSIDNNSSVVNTVFGGQVCDLTNLRTCRGNSDFDATHVINGDYIYNLPFGNGQKLGHNTSGWLNQVIGGWQVSGFYNWRTGFAFNTSASSSSITAGISSPAVLVGSLSSLGTSLHTVTASNGSQTLQLFANPTAAIAALASPNPGEMGSRNTLRGPGYWNTDMAVLKNFKLPWSESQKLQFRWESFNAFNHPNFVEPGANFNSPSTFGVVTTERGAPRQMQFALRLEF